MATKTYDGYRITELRRYATEYKIAGRSKMTGDELLAAVQAVWDARRQAKEAEVLAAGPITLGTLLRHKSSGDIIRVTSEVQTWKAYGALYVEADYVEADGWGADKASRERRAEYQNENNARRTDGGAKHPIWQYERTVDEAPVEVAERELQPHPFLPTMGGGAAAGPCQTKRCGRPYGDPIHGDAAPVLEGTNGAIVVGSIVLRRGEDGADAPRGKVVKVEDGWAHAWVIFAGLLPAIRVRLSTLRLAPEANPSGGKAWAAEIELCPRCGLPASSRLDAPMGSSTVLVTGEPQYPAGTPEYEAYATELQTELSKFAAGEEPYPYAQPRIADDVAALRVQFENLLRDCGVPRASALAVFDRIAAQVLNA